MKSPRFYPVDPTPADKALVAHLVGLASMRLGLGRAQHLVNNAISGIVDFGDGASCDVLTALRAGLALNRDRARGLPADVVVVDQEWYAPFLEPGVDRLVEDLADVWDNACLHCVARATLVVDLADDAPDLLYCADHVPEHLDLAVEQRVA